MSNNIAIFCLLLHVLYQPNAQWKTELNWVVRFSSVFRWGLTVTISFDFSIDV